MQEVAARAGVSLATVSFVVNDSKPVSAATRARVEQAMADLGFRRNVLARALASQRTRIIALAFPALEHKLGTTALNVVTTAALAANERGFNLVLWPVNTVEQLDDYVGGGLVDGVLLMEVTAEDPRVDLLQRRGVPFVLVGRTADPAGLRYVDIDFESAVADGLDHLVGLGHTRVALLLGELHSGSLSGYGPIARTEAAYRAQVLERGLEPVVVRSPQDPRSGREAAARLLEAHPGVTAVLALNEDALHGFVNGLAASGRTLPDDVSVLGLATSPDAVTNADPAVSALVAPGPELGRRGVEAMVDALEAPEAPLVQELVPCTLHLNHSTAAAPAAGA
ncbi:LacI family DNA-binding transcriptional regulator [Puerhibacterium puerhi]|uniref:LacI family DNA-binding transcriptional regulator n=1 Tax=Puerhibacterium puerhi TaxID=2692623 RepID=UPI001358208B|nr:LacI family DNA-binding transcriptional regulator [Puerhibacterium puerhi]